MDKEIPSDGLETVLAEIREQVDALSDEHASGLFIELEAVAIKDPAMWTDDDVAAFYQGFHGIQRIIDKVGRDRVQPIKLESPTLDEARLEEIDRGLTEIQSSLEDVEAIRRGLQDINNWIRPGFIDKLGSGTVENIQNAALNATGSERPFGFR